MGIDAARRDDAHHLGPVALVLQHQRGRDLAGPQDLLLAVDIAEEGVQRPHPLPQPGRHAVPFGPRDDARDDVEGDQPFGVAAFAVDREGDADAAEQQLGLMPLAVQLLARGGAEPTVDFGIGGADALLCPHFVESGGPCLRHGRCGPHIPSFRSAHRKPARTALRPQAPRARELPANLPFCPSPAQHPAMRRHSDGQRRALAADAGARLCWRRGPGVRHTTGER